MKKVIYAAFDDEGVWVYQAFRPAIVAYAVEYGKFGKGFGLNRMSWIKPSLGWILRRSKYASKHRMTAIAKIKLSHQAWLAILEQSISTHFDNNLFDSAFEWQKNLQHSDVLHQWDPERDLQGKRLQRQAIQIGLRGAALAKYAQKDIVQVEDITSLALTLGKSYRTNKTIKLPTVPLEAPYPLSADLMKKLSCTITL